MMDDATRARVTEEGAAVLWTECDAADCAGADRVLELDGAAHERGDLPVPSGPLPGAPRISTVHTVGYRIG